MLFFYISIFVISCLLLYFSSEWIIGGLIRVARLLGVKEFIVAFFIMSFAASIPNLFVGIFSATSGIPELSFGEIAGNNLIAMTLAVVLAVLFSKKKKGIPARGDIVQNSSIFTAVAAIIPIFLILDGTISRTDGIILIGFFLFYIIWIFSKKKRFTKIYKEEKVVLRSFSDLLKNMGKVLVGVSIVIIATQGIIKASVYFASAFDLSALVVGIFIVSIGSALPEVYFAIISARKGEDSLILGTLMGSVIIPSTLVVGIVALIHPIHITSSSPFIIAKVFLIIATLFFFIFSRTNSRITVREAYFLLLIFLLFLSCEFIFALN